jgi:mono/diheme cytochrome c family protein
MKPQPPSRKRRMALFALCLLVLPACRQDMANQPSYRPLQPSDFFPDGRSARPAVPGTVARGQLQLDDALYLGKNEKGEPVDAFPFEMTKDVLQRGKQRYNIFCVVCHGVSGQGDGRIVQRGFTKPPSFLGDSHSYKRRGITVKLWKLPVGHYFDVVTNGYGAMADYAQQVPVRDRWAIIGYIRALQYAQSAEYRAAFNKAKRGKKK